MDEPLKSNLGKSISVKVLYLILQSVILLMAVPNRPEDFHALQSIPTRAHLSNSKNLASEYWPLISVILHDSKQHSEKLH